jgi:hypothetical protein
MKTAFQYSLGISLSIVALLGIYLASSQFCFFLSSIFDTIYLPLISSLALSHILIFISAYLISHFTETRVFHLATIFLIIYFFLYIEYEKELLSQGFFWFVIVFSMLTPSVVAFIGTHKGAKNA